jgi:subtilisin family serine protease
LLIGRADGFGGAAPGADLFAADVYCNTPTGGSTPAILQALDWMAKERVGVVNISLVGPSNTPMKTAIAAMVRRGHLIVAAVGNDGPAAKPLYPAAFDGVIGVTGVDRRNRVLPEAGRGPQVRFAAPGADISAARPGGYVAVRGTSFAAPIVAGLLSRRLEAPDPVKAQGAVNALVASAQDLGAKGFDTTYGNGLVGGDIRPQMKK